MTKTKTKGNQAGWQDICMETQAVKLNKAPNSHYDQDKKNEAWKGCCLGHWNLKLGICLGFGAWCLEFYFLRGPNLL
jgi:hypothetical protein